MPRNGLTRTLRKEQVEVERDGFIVCTDETNFTLWKVGLTDDMLQLYGLHDLRLEVDQWALEKNKPAFVTLEVRFPLSYPSLPPFVRIITPRFAFHTGHMGTSLWVGQFVQSFSQQLVGRLRNEYELHLTVHMRPALGRAGQARAKLKRRFNVLHLSTLEVLGLFRS